MTYCLDNVIEGLTNENFEDYAWSVTIRDTTEDANPLVVKDLKIINKATGKTYYPTDTSSVSLDGSEKEFFIKDTSLNNKVIYYTGFYSPTLHYKSGNGEFTEAVMENNTEREKYVNKFVIENVPEDINLYFSDDKGNIDDNNGQYYCADERLNFYTTEGVADKFEITGTEFKNGEIDLDKHMKMVIHTKGGYELYHYQITIEELDTGKKTFRSYQYLWYIQEPGHVFKNLGGHKFSIEAMDHTGKITTYETVIYPQDLPFEFVEFKAEPEGALFAGENARFTAISKNEGVFSHGLSKNVYDFTIKDEQGNVCYTLSKNNDFADYNERYSETFVDFIPEKKGVYTVSVTSADLNEQVAELSYTFSVIDKTYGDANGDGKVDIKDATAIQKHLAGAGGKNGFYREIADCDFNNVISIKDATCIRKYLAKITGYHKVGQVIEYVPPVTEPETQPATEPATDPVVTTVPIADNRVTFTNSLNWSGTIYCYYWSDATPNMINWPGLPMTNAGLNEFNQTLYTFEVPKEATKVIFTNGTLQTVDIVYPGGEVRYYAEDIKVGNGYSVKEW